MWINIVLDEHMFSFPSLLCKLSYSCLWSHSRPMLNIRPFLRSRHFQVGKISTSWCHDSHKLCCLNSQCLSCREASLHIVVLNRKTLTLNILKNIPFVRRMFASHLVLCKRSSPHPRNQHYFRTHSSLCNYSPGQRTGSLSRHLVLALL